MAVRVGMIPGGGGALGCGRSSHLAEMVPQRGGVCVAEDSMGVVLTLSGEIEVHTVKE